MASLSHLRSSLTYPIAATLVLVTVVPVALVGLLLARYNREYLTTEEKRSLTRQASSLAAEASLFLNSHLTQLESTARALEAGGPVAVSAFESLLQDMAAQPGRAFVYLQILNARGEGAYVRSQMLDERAVADLESAATAAHHQALGGERVEDLLRDTAREHPARAVIALPLESATAGTWGALTGVLDLEPLASRFSDSSAAGLLMSLIDARGDVLVSSHPESRGRNLAELPLVRDFLRRPMRLTRIYEHSDSGPGEVLGSVAPVGAFGLGVLVERPTAEAFAPVRVMQQRTLAVTAVAALVALLIGFALSRRLIVPLQNLTDISTEIAQGNLTARATVEGHNEIARLGGNFNHMATSVEALVRRLKQALRQNQELFLETIRTVATAIDAKDPYTRGHSERVSSYSMVIGRYLELGQDELFQVRIAAILHDVGKLGIQDGILNKPGGLTEDEYRIMRQHPAIGAQIMAPIRMLKDIIPGIRNHHETWDGQGYPDHLREHDIPLVARIIGVADTFDAMTTTRPYQEAMELDFVLSRMRSMAGTRFDPRVVEALIKAVEAGDVTPPRPHQASATAATPEVS
jgi:HD-GYP domain-containing protein (c-di-GMP phosphodiesterase class II)